MAISRTTKDTGTKVVASDDGTWRPAGGGLSGSFRIRLSVVFV
jgi:hypothetical protein